MPSLAPQPTHRGGDLGAARLSSLGRTFARVRQDHTTVRGSLMGQTPETSALSLHHAPADHGSVAVAITAGHRVLKHLVHQLGAARIDAVLPGKLARVREVLDGIAY